MIKKQNNPTTLPLRGTRRPSAGLTKKQRSAVVKKAIAGKDIGKKGPGFKKIFDKGSSINKFLKIDFIFS